MKIIAVILLFVAGAAAADQVPITIDGEFGDWADVDLAWQDPLGDVGASIDFGNLWLADDERFLFLRLETGGEFDLSENNNVLLYLDTDMDAGTGIAVGGIGAELEWRAGQRFGFFAHGGVNNFIRQENIRFRGGPTVTSSGFEIAIGRDTLPDGVNPLFTGSQVRILLMDAGSGDTLPDAGMMLTYTLDVGTAPTVSPRSFERRHPDDLRIVTHNILNDHLFHPTHTASFERLYGAVDPDILNLQELWAHSADQTRDLIASWFDGDWYAAGVEDCKTVSRYPIVGSWAIDSNLAALVDTTASIGTEMLIINAHLPCCGNDSSRQDEVDAIIAFIREAYTSGGVVTLGPGVPVMIVGDLNLVGLAQQIDTLLTGDIQNEALHGPDHAPDPDGTDLTSIVSRQSEKRMGYTWRNDTSNFWPGHLDYQIYSDSNLAQRHDFIVYTPEMSAGELDANGLLAGDSEVSDHLVFVADFASICPADLNDDRLLDLADITMFVAGFMNQDSSADLAEPFGVFDLADVSAFVGSFNAGCP